MMILRAGAARGHAEHGWLDSHHTFSFADYQDPAHLGFRALRVINEDRVAPRTGFGMHAHRDMEILTYVLSGEIEHQDSLGTHDTLHAGEVQRMTAGTGVRHSEMNRSTEPLHFLQIWILPEQAGLAPSYEQRKFEEEARRGRFCLIASPGAEGGSLKLHQDARVYSTLLRAGEAARLELKPGRAAWLQVASGRGKLNNLAVAAGDGVAVTEEQALSLTADEPLEALLFDLA